MDPLILQTAFIALGILLQYLTPYPGLPDFPTPIYMLPPAPSIFFHQLSPTIETPTPSVRTRALFTTQLSLPLHPYSGSGSHTIPIELVHGSHLPWIQYLTPVLACTIAIVSGLVMVSVSISCHCCLPWSLKVERSRRRDMRSRLNFSKLAQKQPLPITRTQRKLEAWWTCP